MVMLHYLAPRFVILIRARPQGYFITIGGRKYFIQKSSGLLATGCPQNQIISVTELRSTLGHSNQRLPGRVKRQNMSPPFGQGPPNMRIPFPPGRDPSTMQNPMPGQGVFGQIGNVPPGTGHNIPSSVSGQGHISPGPGTRLPQPSTGPGPQPGQLVGETIPKPPTPDQTGRCAIGMDKALFRYCKTARAQFYKCIPDGEIRIKSDFLDIVLTRRNGETSGVLVTFNISGTLTTYGSTGNLTYTFDQGGTRIGTGIDETTIGPIHNQATGQVEIINVGRDLRLLLRHTTGNNYKILLLSTIDVINNFQASIVGCNQAPQQTPGVSSASQGRSPHTPGQVPSFQQGGIQGGGPTNVGAMDPNRPSGRHHGGLMHMQGMPQNQQHGGPMHPQGNPGGQGNPPNSQQNNSMNAHGNPQQRGPYQDRSQNPNNVGLQGPGQQFGQGPPNPSNVQGPGQQHGGNPPNLTNVRGQQFGPPSTTNVQSPGQQQSGGPPPFDLPVNRHIRIRRQSSQNLCAASSAPDICGMIKISSNQEKAMLVAEMVSNDITSVIQKLTAKGNSMTEAANQTI
uniref:Shell matrix protein n=1 Tax=Laqueus rubellus TaxID=93892 RepID=A0A3G9CND6_LAQRU